MAIYTTILLRTNLQLWRNHPVQSLRVAQRPNAERFPFNCLAVHLLFCRAALSSYRYVGGYAATTLCSSIVYCPKLSESIFPHHLLVDKTLAIVAIPFAKSDKFNIQHFFYFLWRPTSTEIYTALLKFPCFASYCIKLVTFLRTSNLWIIKLKSQEPRPFSTSLASVTVRWTDELAWNTTAKRH